MSLMIQVLAVIGFALSIYSIFVGKRAEEDVEYRSICDISDKASCTMAFKSEFGRLFGIQNGVYGAAFYALVFVLSFLGFMLVNDLIFYLVVLAFLGSLYLAYILYFKLKNLCIVCTAIYLVNILLLIFSWLAR
jgi:vitamin-K-epoxide reductase (warfarin-sensitive)